MKNKTLCIRLLACLLALALAPTALAAEAGERTVTIGTGIKDRPAAKVDLPWDDGWFAGDAAVYRQDLAARPISARTGMAVSGTD